MNIKNIISVLLATGFTLAAFTVEAVPSFARNEGKNCSYCHNAWPQLNNKGRTYKELGYRLPDSSLMSFKDIAEESVFPVSAVLVARPYDKKDSGDYKIRALHEVEVMIAGQIGDGWSGFVELEAEDEDTNARGLEVGVSNAVLAYGYNEAVNLQLNYGPTLWADPYGFLGDSFRLTRGHVGVIDQKFGGVDGAVRSTRQNVAVTGRPIGQLFYSVGISGEAGDAEGVEASTLHARLAFDVTKDIMIGGFVIDGEVAAVGAGSDGTSVEPCTGAGTPDTSCADANDSYNKTTVGSSAIDVREYQRIGLDAQADIGNARVQLAYISGTDDTSTPGTEVDNDAVSLQAYYVMKSETGAPTWVPLIRFDTYEKNDGADSYDEVTLNLTRYITQNAKAYLEYWDRSGPTSAKDDDRLTVQLAVGF